MAPRSTTAAGEPGRPADYPARVAELAPVIAGAAEQADRERRLPPELLAALHGAGLFRLLLPQPYGGAELDPPSFARTIEAVAKLDASTAWCLCQANGCAMSAAYLDPAVAKHIWGDDPNAVLAWGPGAPGTKSRAIVEGTGYRITGQWSFASGGRHATWLGGASTVLEADGTPRRAADGARIERIMLFPAAAAPMTDAWDVIGLRGTGSDAYAVDGLFVPGAYSVARDDPAERRLDTPLYQFPAMSLYAAGFAGTALGIARAMLDDFKALADDKKPRLTAKLLRDDGTIQAAVARCEARLGAARAFLMAELADVWHAVVASGRLAVADRMRIRLAATHAIHEAKWAADTAYDLAGATAIFAAGPYERRFRDIHTVAQQLQGRRTHYRTVGAYLLGHDPDMSVI